MAELRIRGPVYDLKVSGADEIDRTVSEIRHGGDLVLAWPDLPPDEGIVGLGGCAAFAETGELAAFGFVTHSGSAFVAFCADSVRVRRIPTAEPISRIGFVLVDDRLQVDVGGTWPSQSFRVETGEKPDPWFGVGLVKCDDRSGSWVPETVVVLPARPAAKPTADSPGASEKLPSGKQPVALLHRPVDRDDYVSCPPNHAMEKLDLESGKDYRWFSRTIDTSMTRDLEQHQIRRIEDLIRSSTYEPIAEELFRRAEVAGFNLFVVGGAVRDAVLGERPNDLDLAGDVPPSIFRRWVRELGAQHDRDLLVSTSTNNVTHVKQRKPTGEVIDFVEYGLFKARKEGDNWVGCNDICEDYRTRDTAENSLMYDTVTKKVISASDRLEEWTTDGKLDADKFRTSVTPILGHRDVPTKIHESFDKWGYINLLARIMKTYIRLTPKNDRGPDAQEPAFRIAGIGEDLRDDLKAVGDVFGVSEDILLAAAVLEAEPRGGTAAVRVCQWLDDLLALAAAEPGQEAQINAWKEIEGWMESAKAHLKEVGGPDAKLVGDGLLKVTKKRQSWVADQAALSLFTSFTPKQVAAKLKGLIAGWELYAVPISLGNSEPIVARAWWNPDSELDSFLVEVDDGKLVRAERDLPEFDASSMGGAR